MTLEKLVGLTADDWEKLSDAELEVLLSPYFNAARPDPSKLKQSHTNGRSKSEPLNQKLQRESAIQMLKQMGMDDVIKNLQK